MDLLQSPYYCVVDTLNNAHVFHLRGWHNPTSETGTLEKGDPEVERPSNKMLRKPLILIGFTLWTPGCNRHHQEYHIFSGESVNPYTFMTIVTVTGLGVRPNQYLSHINLSWRVSLWRARGLGRCASAPDSYARAGVVHQPFAAECSGGESGGLNLMIFGHTKWSLNEDVFLSQILKLVWDIFTNWVVLGVNVGNFIMHFLCLGIEHGCFIPASYLGLPENWVVPSARVLISFKEGTSSGFHLTCKSCFLCQVSHVASQHHSAIKMSLLRCGWRLSEWKQRFPIEKIWKYFSTFILVGWDIL